MDLAGIAEAIATRFSAANVTPPSGLDNIRQSTHRLPPGITHWPTVLVFPPEQATFEHGASRRTADLLFPVRWYIAPTSDLARALDAAYAWWDVLVEQLVGQVQLGESAQGVTHAVMQDARIGLLTYPAAALLPPGTEPSPFMGIETGVLVHIAEGKNYTA